MIQSVICLGACAAAVACILAPASVPAQDEKPYSVVDGKVDKGTYNGYRRYHASCHTCHGPGRAGQLLRPQPSGIR